MTISVDVAEVQTWRSRLGLTGAGVRAGRWTLNPNLVLI